MIPKFRFYDKHYGLWLNPECVWLDEKGNFRGIDGVNRFESLDDIILMQSTGLFDKNGVEIFDGDVIVAMSQGVKAIGEVKRRIDGYWLMYPSWQHGEFWHIVENVDTGETGVEVIGNIYENPDLLESVEE